MNKLLLLALTVAMPAMAMAADNVNTTNDVLQPMEITVPEITNDAEGTLAAKTSDNPFGLTTNEEQGEKYYTNWLGEKCIDFGNDQRTYYNWKRDVTYAGIPVFLSSFIIKSQKKAFRSARFSLDKGWKSEIDNYTQFSPYAVVVGLKALGYEGRSSWDRLMVSALASNAVMALAVNATKYSVKEMRPDNSTRNSFPSGHTATAFVAATVLHKEYGLTRSPWFSVGGYAVAMTTGFMRVLNNRHWISDVMAGAGIGILSTELGYFIGDVIYKNYGVQRRELTNITDPNHPSFFDIQMGVGMHSSKIGFDFEDGDHSEIQLGTSTAVGIEGAYFFNKYFGIGGMVRATTTPTRGLGVTADEQEAFGEVNNELELVDMPRIEHITLSNNNFVDFSFDAGVYGNLPLSNRFSLGAKMLLGARVSNGFEFKAKAGYREMAKDQYGNPIYTLAGGAGAVKQPVYLYEYSDGNTFFANETLMPGVSSEYNYHLDQSKYVSDEYTLSKVTGGSSLNYVFGLSLTYKYKNNFSWKIFLDYDSAKPKYTYTFRALDDTTADAMMQIAQANPDGDKALTGQMYTNLLHNTTLNGVAKKRMNLFTLGAAFSINF